MDRAYLMVLIPGENGIWKIIFKGTYNECMDKSCYLDEMESWMIVRPAREHFGTEIMTINN